jgi:hypothetical protein
VSAVTGTDLDRFYQQTGAAVTVYVFEVPFSNLGKTNGYSKVFSSLAIPKRKMRLSSESPFHFPST